MTRERSFAVAKLARTPIPVSTNCGESKVRYVLTTRGSGRQEAKRCLNDGAALEGLPEVGREHEAVEEAVLKVYSLCLR